MKKYEVKKVSPHVYLDQVDNAVQGFKVTLYLPAYDETHFLSVPSTDPEVVKIAAEKLIADREALASLGD